MTLSERNTFFKTGIAFCATVTLLIIAVSFFTLPIYHAMEDNPHRPGNISQFITGWLLKTDYLAVHAGLFLAVLFSLVSMIMIYFFFLRTSAQEILFISFFSVSFSVEAIRLVIPLHILNTLPIFYLITVTRILLFARYFSIFSLFTASVCAAGMEVQRTRNVIFIIIIASLVISMGVPIDVQTWDTCFNFLTGYSGMLFTIEILTFIATIISFFVAVKNRNSKDYIFVGIGAAIALIGRNVLLGTDNWAGPITGIILLSVGTWVTCSKLHNIHLWL